MASTALGMFIFGYAFATLSYDFDNYFNYVSRPELTAIRFRFEPGFVWITKSLLTIAPTAQEATRLLYGCCFGVLSFGVVRLGYSVRTSLGLHSHYIVFLSFLTCLPLLGLIWIVPRQCLSIGFSFLAISYFFDWRTNVEDNYTLSLAIITALISAVFHNISFLFCTSVFLFLFISVRKFVLLFFIISIAVIIASIFLNILEILPFVGSVYAYFSYEEKDTGIYRLISFVSIIILYTFKLNRIHSYALGFGCGLRWKLIFLLALSVFLYTFVAADSVRAFYFPTIMVWMIVAVSSIQRGGSQQSFKKTGL